MPKLNEVARGERRRRIEDAALRLFRKRGFHGVGLRDICAEGGFTVGAVYAHFASKEAIFRSLMDRLYDAFRDPAQPMGRYFTAPTFPDDLEGFAGAIEEMVARHEDYLLLVFVDVVELEGSHIREHYASLADRFRAILGPHLEAQRAAGRLGELDGAVAFAAVYMQFFNYFMVRRIFGVTDHLGPSDAAVVGELARLFRDGLRPRPSPQPIAGGSSDDPEPSPRDARPPERARGAAPRARAPRRVRDRERDRVRRARPR